MVDVRNSPSGPLVTVPPSGTANAIELSDTTVLSIGAIPDGSILVRDGFTVSGDALIRWIDFIHTATGVIPHREGRIWWDVEQHALAVYDDQDETILQVGQEVRFRGVNKTGGTLSDGTAVYVLGAQGNRPVIWPGIATSAATSEIVGLITQAIDDNQEGWVTMIGTVSSYDTRPFAPGNVLYLSATVLGGLQNTEPTGTDIVRTVGLALNSTVNGLIGVNPFGARYLSALFDVNDGAPNVAGKLLVATGTHWTSATALHLEGIGSPEGVVAAPLGSTYRNLSGGVGTTFFVKEAGASGNTGWAAK